MLIRATLAALALTAIAATPVNAAAPVTFRVVGTGDSILAMAYGVPAPGGVTIPRPGTWVQVEYGRNAYTAGMLGTAGSSTKSIALLAISRSQSGGWIIVQDNGLGVSDTAWRTLMRDIVAAAPDDRCLVGVLPAYRADVDPGRAAMMRARAVVMAEEFMRHPCRRFVYMAQIIARFPDDFLDGQHPRTAAAQAAIRTAVGVL
jgi:hypothetical protein